MPQAAKLAVQIAADSVGQTVSQLIREAIIAHLSLIIAPLLRDRAESEPIKPKMATLSALNAIRTGITACSAPGRRLRARHRAFYALHCAQCARNSIAKPTFTEWLASPSALAAALPRNRDREVR